MEKVRAVVQNVMPDGKHGPYAVATSDDITGSVTFSLEPTVWQDEDWPEQGSIVILSKLRQKRAGWRAKLGRFSQPSDEQISNDSNSERSIQMKKQNNSNACILVMTNNALRNFPEGAHGNGAVVTLYADTKAFESNDEQARLDLHFKTFNLMGREVSDAYVYLGRYDTTPNDPKLKAFQQMINTASAHVKDNSRIHIVGCSCNGHLKREFAQHRGYSFIESDCGADQTLENIIRDALANVPKEPEAKAVLTLTEEFATEPSEEDRFSSRLYFDQLTAVNDVLFAGMGTGQVFWNRDGNWEPSPLKMDQGVNLMVPDGDSILVGDGSCCDGATYRLSLDGTIEHILPVEGQSANHYHQGNVQCNVYGFARVNGTLITGGGGCAGQHIYRQNTDGQWEYLPNDPKSYVTGMLTASDGNAYICMGDQGKDQVLYRYDGENFQRIGRVRLSGLPIIFEYNGSIFVGATDSGYVSPTTFSVGTIYRLDGDNLIEEWSGAGGVDNMFVHQGKLYASGTNRAIYKTSVMRREIDGTWTKLFQFDETVTVMFEHNGTVYAGGRKSTGEKMYAAVLYTVNGL